jgi:hypothetical protein
LGTEKNEKKRERKSEKRRGKHWGNQATITHLQIKLRLF